MDKLIVEVSKIASPIVMVIISGVFSAVLWVGNIQNDVKILKEDRIELSKKVDSIKENTDFIRGKLEIIQDSRGHNK